MYVGGQLYALVIFISFDIHSIGLWVDHRAAMDTAEDERILRPFRESNPNTSVIRPVV